MQEAIVNLLLGEIPFLLMRDVIIGPEGAQGVEVC